MRYQSAKESNLTRRIFRNLDIEHCLKPEDKRYKASNERPNPFKMQLIE